MYLERIRRDLMGIMTLGVPVNNCNLQICKDPLGLLANRPNRDSIRTANLSGHSSLVNPCPTSQLLNRTPEHEIFIESILTCSFISPITKIQLIHQIEHPCQKTNHLKSPPQIPFSKAHQSHKHHISCPDNQYPQNYPPPRNRTGK